MRMNAGSIGSFEVQNSADDAVRAENDELGRENVVLRAENAELKQVCAELKQIVSEQFGWREVRVDGVGGREYFYNPFLGIRVWLRQGLHCLVSIRVGMLVETNADIKCTLAVHGYGGVVKVRTWIVILYVGENDDEAGYIYGQVFETGLRLWLSFTSIRELGGQVPLVLGDVAAAAGGEDGVFLRGLDSSYISYPSTLNSRSGITFDSSAFFLPAQRRFALIFSDSILLSRDENCVCVIENVSGN